MRQTDAAGGAVAYAYNLTGAVVRMESAGKAVQQLAYDAQGRMTGVQDGEQHWTRYELDDWGRIIGIEKADGSTERYRYNFAGDITESTDGEGRTTRYAYNCMGLLSAVTDPTGEQERYEYDAQGRLIRKTDRNEKVTELAYNLYDAPLYRRGEGVEEVYEYTEDGLLRSAICAGMRYSYAYDAWGNLLTKEEKIPNRYTYYGQQLDQITQQYYLRARFYNPVFGRFTQEDTYRGDGLNLYAYCANNPVRYIDPTGFDKEAHKGDSEAKPLFPRGDKPPYEILIKQDEIALDTYTKLRKTGLDANEIEVFASNTGLDIDTAKKLKEHIFLTEHANLLNCDTKAYFSDYFQPDIHIAYGWEKALQGELSDIEKNWFKQLADHELAESELMKQGELYRTIESIDINGISTGSPPGAHDKAPKPPGDFPGFVPKI